ncbi:MAG: carbon-nitrogen hydrolase family protein [Chloroflexi bacterium]|nr:carbon-nitrogen hydrolase family protein [Chloroflexota bacterium]
MLFRVALLQLAGHGTDVAANLATGEAACRYARELGADLALFPEMWSVAYTSFCPPTAGASDLWRAPSRWTSEPSVSTLDSPEVQEARRAWQALAVGRDDPYVTHFRALARELDLAIALTYLERWDGPPRNTVSIIDRRGEIVLTYAKVHTCDFDYPEAALTPGDAFPVATLQTRDGEVMVGAMICYDREFPEAARCLMLGGAEIVLIPNACTMEANRLGQLRARAFENMVGVALANYAPPRANGHSVAYDPIAFDAAGPRDTLVLEAGEAEGVYLAAFDLTRIRSWRERETWGNAFRRPHRYGALVDGNCQPPFVRTDRSGVIYDPRTR